jgi:FOG: PKD repeat
MKINQKLNSIALASAALILFISLLSSTAIAALPNSPGTVNVKFMASPTTGYAPLTVQFNDQTTFGIGGVINNRYWDFGDGTTSGWWSGTGSSSLNKNPKHTYTAPGEYKVELIEGATFPVKDPDEGYYNDSISTKIIKVLKTPVTKIPVAAFTASPTSGKHPLNVQFTDKSINNPTSWSWKFGDGSTSTAQKPSHKYTKKGTYSVSLTVKNTAGSNSITKSKYITVK